MAERDDILKEFLAESTEGLDQYEKDVVDLERAPGDPRIVGRMFRVIHTLKGNSGFLGFAGLETLAHAGEHLLGAIRDGHRPVTPDVADALLALCDDVRRVLEVVERTGRDRDDMPGELIGRLKALHPGANGAARGAASRPARGGPAAEEVSPASGGDESVRVGIRLLDRLMNLADELVLVRNRVEGFPALHADDALRESAQQLDLVATELQAEVMRLRMQRLTVLWTRLPRLVRDTAAACNRQVAFTMTGEEIELDRAIVEAIRDPLVHLVRNAVDHGIEPSDTRRARGKPAAGAVSVRARYEGGQVRIEIEDDGAGIDPEIIRRTVVERGLAGAGEAAALGRRELLRFLFLPGFSTADRVTNVSGRGVGLDVVQTNVERIGGTVDVQSTVGGGTLVAITLPLTLAVLPALLVSAAGQTYALPQINVREVIRLEDGRDVEWVHAAPVFRHRGGLLPLVSLGAVLEGGRGTGEFRDPAFRADGRHVGVIEVGTWRFGLALDGVLDVQDLVVRPRSPYLGASPVFAGSTILGDGRVALILDVLEVARIARITASAGTAASRPAHAAEVTPSPRAERLLLFQSDDGGRMVMPFARVGRVARIPANAIERSGARDVVQYQGGLLPLVRVADAVPERRSRPRAATASDPVEDLHVVVLANGPHRLGLVVARVLDIVTEPLAIERPTGRPGVSGTAVVRGQATEVFDVEDAIRKLDPGFLEDRAEALAA